MTIKKSVSKQTRDNWIIDAGLFLSAVMAILSGAYFLYLPVGGYQGGRNPAYIAEIFGMNKDLWIDIHTWTGYAFVILVLVHLLLHATFIKNIVRYARGTKRAPEICDE